MTLKRRKLNRDKVALLLLAKQLKSNKAPDIKLPKLTIAFKDDKNGKQFIEEYKELTKAKELETKNENNPS